MNIFRPWDLFLNIVSRGKCHDVGSAVGGIVGLGSAAASAYGPFVSAGGAEEAAQRQQMATMQALQTQQNMYDEAVRRMDPYYQQGLRYQETLAQRMPELTRRYDYGMYRGSPEYANQLLAMQQTRDAMAAQGAASGMYGGGTYGAAMQQRANELAQQGYAQGLQDYIAQNQAIYGMYQPLVAAGQNIATTMGGQAMNLGANLANTLMGGTAEQNRYADLAAQRYGDAISNVGTSATQAFGGLKSTFPNVFK